MAHLNFNRPKGGPAVPEAWLPATAAATQFAIKISGRRDLAVKVAPGFAKAAGTAMFSPHLAEIEVDSDVMMPGIKPEDVNLADDLFRARCRLFVGSLVHESAHARYTRWVPVDLFAEDMPFNKRKVDVLVALEESRIEKRMLNRYPVQREALGAIVFDLLGKDFKVSDDPYGASMAAALVLARVDSASITEAEAKPFRAIVAEKLDADTLAVLRGLWREYHALMFREYEPLPIDAMDSIATRWIEALGMDANDEGGEGMACEFAMGGEGEEGEGGEGEGEGDMERKLKDAAAKAKHAKDMDAADDVGEIKAARRAAERAADKARHDKGKKAAKSAFGTAGAPVVTGREGGKHGYTRSGRSTVRWRKPTDRERAAGVRLSRLLEKVIYSDRRTAKVKQEMPGGRLHGRGQVQRVAQKATGQRPTALGWTVKKRTHVDEPKVRVGVMLDVSGSMGAQAAIAGSLAYAMGNAVERVGGEFGMVLFGDSVLGLIKPGQKLDVAPDIDAACGWENFSKAFYALDSEMDLVDGEGLRVLVLLSDGVFVNDSERALADAVLPMLASKGVVIIHVDIDGDVIGSHYTEYNPRHNNPYPPVTISRRMDTVKAVNLIGEHLLESIKRYKNIAA
jgi:hypothetical protein